MLKYKVLMTRESRVLGCKPKLKGQQIMGNVFTGCVESRRMNALWNIHIVCKHKWSTVVDNVEVVINIIKDEKRTKGAPFDVCDG